MSPKKPQLDIEKYQIHCNTLYKAHAAPQGSCENLINALKLLVKAQKDRDSPIQSTVAGSFLKETGKELRRA